MRAANTARWKKAAAAQGVDPSTGHKSVQTNAMDSVRTDVTDSVKFVKTDATDSETFVQINVMDAVKTMTGSAKAMQTSATDAVELVRIGVMDSVFIQGAKHANVRRRRAR